jgi:hypothetical protein
MIGKRMKGFAAFILRLARGAAPLGGVVLLLAGLLLAGKLIRDEVAQHDRYRFPFNHIICATPPGLDRGEFLDEVQYLASLPDRLNVLDDGLPERLAKAFAGHPWVEKVEGVEIVSAQEVRVRLLFRTPVLAVELPGEAKRLAVDRHGVRLPGNADTRDLPIFSGKISPPAGPAGSRWGDPAVEAAARAASKSMSTAKP